MHEPSSKPRVLLICHREAPLHSDGVARWLASWADLAGIVILNEPPARKWQRLRRERRRVGILRLLDVLAFQFFYRLVVAARDAKWKRALLERLREGYAPVRRDVPVLHTVSPNSEEASRFIRAAAPDLTLALCKNLLKEAVFTIPRCGTFVLHPGICPEYRNAHGCFWALASDDRERVGMTMVRIDRGIDTGPVYGYFHAAYDERRDSHVVIQHRVVFDNLDAIAARLREIVSGTAQTIRTDGRASHEWGQPWLTRYLAWKLKARRRAACESSPLSTTT